MGTIYQRIAWIIARRWDQHKAVATYCLCVVVVVDNHFSRFLLKALCTDNMHTNSAIIRVFLHDGTNPVNQASLCEKTVEYLGEI